MLARFVKGALSIPRRRAHDPGKDDTGTGIDGIVDWGE
jgi:hypothetical protein